MLIGTGKLDQGSLRGWTVIVTGAGGGIGLEAARSLLWLGAEVVIAEIDQASSRAAQSALAAEWPSGRMLFVPTDVGDEAGVKSLVAAAESRFGKVDAVLNNATYSPAGRSVVEMPIDTWDRSYRVNLRGPVLLARACLPGMITRRRGVFGCVSSTGGPFLAAYEALKSAQVELANSLDGELAGTGVSVFTIGPGLVPTATATSAIEILAPRLGMSPKELWAMNAATVLSVEAAGAGFAAAIAMAERYAGQEISSSQALVDAGIVIGPASGGAPHPAVAERQLAGAEDACSAVVKTLTEQYQGWQERSFFERQWMLRDFKQRVGMPAERCLETLQQLRTAVAAGRVQESELAAWDPMLRRLADFYQHMAELAAGYVKDAGERDRQVAMVSSWKREVEKLAGTVAPRVAVS